MPSGTTSVRRPPHRSLPTAPSPPPPHAQQFPRASVPQAPCPQGPHPQLNPASLPPCCTRQFPPPLQVTVGAPLRTSGPFWQRWETGIGGGCSVFSPPESFWCGETAAPNGSAGYSCTSGLQYNATLLPRAPYRSLREGTGVSLGRAVVHFWHDAHWASLMGLVDRQDAAKSTLSWSLGGFQSSRGVGTWAYSAHIVSLHPSWRIFQMPPSCGAAAASLHHAKPSHPFALLAYSHGYWPT